MDEKNGIALNMMQVANFPAIISIQINNSKKQSKFMKNGKIG